MSEQELIEQLADKEHASWARWMAYLFSVCVPDPQMDGALLIAPAWVRHWQQEIETAYADLPESYKQSDRDEVAHILPLIRAYVEASNT
jgi:hypothetical protein